MDTTLHRPVVELRGVFWGPKGCPDILSDISFAVPQGQIMVICGANGAGKSSLLRLIYRHQAPRRGMVHLLGRDIWKMRSVESAQILAAVLQEQPSDLALTARQIVALGRLPHRTGWGAGFSSMSRADERIVDSAMERMDLTGMHQRPFGMLSGGERQRVIVARALAQEPKVIVLDEPTNHLDIRHQLELLGILKNLGLTVIATLHDLTLAADFADRILLMSRGRIIADGLPEDVLNEASVATAFDVKSRINHMDEKMHFSFHL